MSRKALIVGINYRGTSSELNGCINDAKNMQAFIQSKGYSDITLMTDDTPVKPTRVNILKALLELVLSGASHLFFHYSGHGSYVRDTNGDEADGRDETLYPLDGEMIIDDELRGILCCLRPNQTLIAVLDCCHSGSGMDLAYNLYAKVGSSTFTLVKDNKAFQTAGQVIMLSGCADTQTSADSWDEQRKEFAGALTKTVLATLQKQATITWQGLLAAVRQQLRQERFSQVPMLSSGKALSLGSKIAW